MELRRIKASEVQEQRFYQLPKFLVHDERFKGLSSDAKLLYAILRDRHELSLKNNWVDDDGYVFIIYTRADMMNALGLSDKPITKAIKDLKKYGLIDEKRHGLNKPNLIYVLTVDYDSQWKSKSFTSRSKEFLPQEVKNFYPNDTNINKTNNSDTKTTTTHEPQEQEEQKSVSSSNKQTIESTTKLKLTSYQTKTVASWDTEKLYRAIEIFNKQDGQFFNLLLKIYNEGAIDNISNSVGTGARQVSSKVEQYNQMDSRDDWDFDEIEKLEREYINRKLSK